MTNKELQDILKKYPDDIIIVKETPIQGDSENVVSFTEKDFFYDERYPFLVF